MKTLALVALWSFAVLLAVCVLWRILRRKKIVLTGRWSPRVVQMVAAIVVAFSPLARDDPAFAEDSPAPRGKLDPDAAAPAAEDVLPLDSQTISQWRRAYAYRGSHLQRFKQVFAPLEAGGVPPDATVRVREQVRQLIRTLPDRLRVLILADLAAQAKGQAPSIVASADLVAALTQLEHAGCLDSWLLGYVWRAAARRPSSTRHEDLSLFRAMHHYARLVDVMVLSQGRVKAAAFQPRAWMSKAGPTAKALAHEDGVVKALLREARTAWPTLKSESWSRDAFAELGLAKGSSKVLLYRGNKVLVLQAEDTLVRFGRLDLLAVPRDAPPVVLTHVWLGAIALPAGRTYSVWDLPGILPTTVRARIRRAVRKALKGDEQAAARLESTLPLSHAAIKRGLAVDAKAPGAPRVRTILSLFEERVLFPTK